jgi:hypothetical protein
MIYTFKEDYTATYYTAGNSIAVPFKRGTRVNGEFVAGYTTPGEYAPSIMGPMTFPASVHIDNPDYVQQGDAYPAFAMPPRKLFIPPSKLESTGIAHGSPSSFSNKEMKTALILALIIAIIYFTLIYKK